MQSLDASLRLIGPQLPESLVPEAALDAAIGLAAKLAPIHCAGFEIRLGAADGDVDFAQRVRSFRGEPAMLSRHIAVAGLSTSPAWRRLQEFCDEWSRPASVLQRSAAAGWLEFDARVMEAEHPVPSVFLTFEHRQPERVADELVELVDAAFRLLQGQPLGAGLAATIGRCVAACPPTAQPTDAGFMLPRQLQAVRLVFSPLSLAEATELLSCLDWAGSARDLEAAGAALGNPDGLVLSIDVGERLGPRVGIEYFPGSPAAQLTRWEPVLDNLVEAGLCRPEKRHALLSWPGYLHPDAVDGAWPDALIIDSLLGRPDEFSVIGRRLNNIKLVCEPGAPLQAKAYFGFGPLRLAVLPEADDDAPRAPTAANHDIDSDESGARAEAAIEAAVAFLSGRRRTDGWWHDFAAVMGGSDEWVTAYVGSAAAGVDGEAARSLAESAWKALLGRRSPTAGWGFNAGLPDDADGTCWALRLAEALGQHDHERAAAAEHVLRGHFRDGAVRSYVDDAAKVLRGKLGDHGMRGLLATHTCVTAAAAALPACGEHLAPHLRDAQQADGRWVGYWWIDDEFTTALAVEALTRLGNDDDRQRLQAAKRWASTRIDVHGAVRSRWLNGPSPFATASCARILAIGAEEESAAALRRLAAAWLLDAQRPDGSWAPSALMRIPPSESVDPESNQAANFVGVDDGSLFTTATVLTALARALEAGHSSVAPSSTASSTSPP